MSLRQGYWAFLLLLVANASASTLSVTAESVVMRERASFLSPEITLLQRQDKLTLVQETNDWLFVTDVNNTQGWIHRSAGVAQAATKVVAIPRSKVSAPPRSVVPSVGISRTPISTSGTKSAENKPLSGALGQLFGRKPTTLSSLPVSKPQSINSDVLTLAGKGLSESDGVGNNAVTNREHGYVARMIQRKASADTVRNFTQGGQLSQRQLVSVKP